MDSSEGEFPVLRFPVVEACRFHLSGGLVYPAVQVVVVVKKEIENYVRTKPRTES